MAPEWLHSLALRARAARNRGRLERDLEDELAFHLAMKAEEAQANGASAREARAAAERRFGNSVLAKESLREAWTFAWLESVWRDFRHAGRALRKAPVFTVVAVLSLAIGIGANTSTFTVFNALFLRSLPVRNPEELRILNWTGRGGDVVRSTSGYTDFQGNGQSSSSFSFEAFEAIAKEPVFASAAGFAPLNVNVYANGQARDAGAQMVTGRYFETLGAQAALGRTLVRTIRSPRHPPWCSVGGSSNSSLRVFRPRSARPS